MSAELREDATPAKASKIPTINGRYRVVASKRGEWKAVRGFRQYTGSFPCNHYPQVLEAVTTHNKVLRERHEAQMGVLKEHNKAEREKAKKDPNYKPSLQTFSSKRMRPTNDERFTMALLLLERADAIWEKQVGHAVTADEVHRLMEPFNKMASALNLRGKEKDAVKRIYAAQLRHIAHEMRKAS